MSKYELTDETITLRGQTLHRIRAIRDFGKVKSGDLGGFVKSKLNLSHNGDCWVSGNARVSGDAWVSGDARVSGNARVSGDAWVSGDAQVSGDARIVVTTEYLVVTNMGSRSDTLTFYKTGGGIGVSCWCFVGSIEEFISRVESVYGDNEHGQGYKLACDIARLRIKL